jgi:hypothetical protein
MEMAKQLELAKLLTEMTSNTEMSIHHYYGHKAECGCELISKCNSIRAQLYYECDAKRWKAKKALFDEIGLTFEAMLESLS